MPTPPERQRRRGSLRLRLTIVATAVAAIPLLAGAIALATSLRTQLYRDATNDALGKCIMITSRFTGLSEPDPYRWLVKGSACDLGTGMTLIERDSSFRPVPYDTHPRWSLTHNSTVLAPEHLAEGTTELLVGRADSVIIESEGAGLSLWPFADGSSASIRVFRRLEDAASVFFAPDGVAPSFVPDEFVTWSRSLKREQDTLNRALFALAGGSVLMIGLIGATTWIAVGWVVRPVEAIRRRVAEITTENLGHRVPVPRARTEIARLAETMNDTLARLEHAVSEQRRFVADASHELRGPIAALRSELEIAHTHPEQARWPEVVAGALEDTERLQDLASDLLLLSRLDAKPPELDEIVDLVALAGEEGTLRRLRGQLTLHYDLAAEEVTVQGRHGLLGRLVRNLLDNAERHAASSITLRVAVEGSAAVLEVIDDGPGIPGADRERIFDRFTRLDEARARDTGGAGLGLAIARHIAVIHGGTLAVADSGHGARFRVVLTRAEHR